VSTAQGSATEQLAQLTSSGGTSAVAGLSSQLGDTRTAESLASLISMGETLRTYLPLVKVSAQDWAKFQSIVTGSSHAAAVVALLTAFVSWIFVLRLYRSRLLAMRRGVYFFNRVKFSQGTAGRFLGYQVMHGVVAYLLLWGLLAFVLVIISTIFAFPSVLRAVWDATSVLLISTLTTTLIVTLVMTFVTKLILIKDESVVHRRTFAVFDFVFTWLNLASGITVAVARAAVNAVVAIILYGRVDMSLLPSTFEFMDAAFASYVGMALLDHRHNHPVCVVFSDIMIWRLKLRRRNQKRLVSSECGSEVELRLIQPGTEPPVHV